MRDESTAILFWNEKLLKIIKNPKLFNAIPAYLRKDSVKNKSIFRLLSGIG